MKVLIADDSEPIRKRLSDLISELEGVEIAGQAGSVTDAVDSVIRLKPDVVILDIRMPGGSGLDVLEKIKKSMPWVCVIMLTNYPEAPYRKKCQEAGAEYFFDKSSEFEKVGEALMKFIASEFRGIHGAIESVT